MTRHTADTANPQTYGEHFRVSFFGSLSLIWFGLAGLVHAFFPEIKCLQFYTSSGIIRAYRQLELSRRHDSEIAAIFGQPRMTYIAMIRKGWQG